MSVKLFFEAILKFLLGVILVGALIFLPAGSLCYLGGWLLMGLLFVPMFIAGIVMMIRSPELLARRLNGKEKLSEQGTVVKLSGLMFLLGFIVSGLGYRFGWFTLPKGVTIIGAVLFIVSYAMYAVVLKQNVYLSRTVAVEEDQRVIDSGLYSVVRHPMYSATLLLFLSMPLILGSLYALLIFLAYPAIIIKRLKSEEQFLSENLPGYRDYLKKVKYRLIPFIW